MKNLLHTVCSLAFLLALSTGSYAGISSNEEIDAKVQQSLQEFYQYTSAGKSLSEKAAGILVFPSVVKAGVGLGGEYGEGALIVNGETAGYYSTAAASIGFQLGAQARSQIILFMNEEVLSKFQASDGWKVGVDGSVALATLGAGEEISTDTAQKPIIGFIFSNKGLMYNLSLEGSKITRINDDE